MQKVSREQARKYAFDWRDEPLIQVRPGEAFEVETYDASTGYFKTPEDKAIPAKRPGFDRTPPTANPIGGPVYLDGAERGDVVVVCIEDIVVDDYSWVAVGPRRGPQLPQGDGQVRDRLQVARHRLARERRVDRGQRRVYVGATHRMPSSAS